MKKSSKWPSVIFTISMIALITFELLTLFILGPIRALQDMKNMGELSYFLTMNLPYIRIALLLIIVWSAFKIFKLKKKYPKVLAIIALLIYTTIFYVSNFQLKADRLFYDQNDSSYELVESNVVPLDMEVLGVSLNGESKAYPLEFLSYHHKVLDSVGNEPILATYCIWCRCGRVFSPVIDGELAQFRLVGINEYNAIIEDKSSKTWWQQATGEAIAGKKKGNSLDEIYCEQMSLESWIEKYPKTKVLQPDSSFIEEYIHNGRFVSRFCEEDNGQALEPWEERSWVIGVSEGTHSIAFDYLSLLEKHTLQDSVGDIPVLVLLESEKGYFHAWDRRIDTMALHFDYLEPLHQLRDIETGSYWNLDGKCISGIFIDEQLSDVQSYEEYWHSWQSFHPNTGKSE